MCGEVQEVGDKCEEVICDCCLIAGVPPLYSKDGIDYYTEEAMSDLLGESKDKERPKEIWKGAQRMRNEGLSLRVIAEKLECSHEAIRKHTVNQKV